MRDSVRAALFDIAARFSADAPPLDSIEPVLEKRYPGLEVWPADAQLGLFVLAWVLGPGFSIPGFRRAVSGLLPDFRAAARAAALEGNATLVALSEITGTAFVNAALVVRWDLRADVLYWPIALGRCRGAEY